MAPQSARDRCDEVPCTQLSPAPMGQAVPGEAVGLSSDVEEPVRGEAAAPRRARAQELLMSGPETCKRAGPAAPGFVGHTLRAFSNAELARSILLNPPLITSLETLASTNDQDGREAFLVAEALPVALVAPRLAHQQTRPLRQEHSNGETHNHVADGTATYCRLDLRFA